jgi:hypothetical protein
MRKWGNWSLDGAILTHHKTGGRVSIALVRTLAEIPQAMEVQYNLHAIGPMDLIHLAAALIEIVGEREKP